MREITKLGLWVSCDIDSLTLEPFEERVMEPMRATAEVEIRKRGAQGDFVLLRGYNDIAAMGNMADFRVLDIHDKEEWERHVGAQDKILHETYERAKRSCS